MPPHSLLPVDEAELLGRRAAKAAQDYVLEVLGLTPGRPVTVQDMNAVAVALAYTLGHLEALVRLQAPHIPLADLRNHVVVVSDGIVAGIQEKLRDAMAKGADAPERKA